MIDQVPRLSLDSVLTLVRDVVRSENSPLEAIGVIPSRGGNGYAEILFTSPRPDTASPVAVGISRTGSPEQLRAHLISELRDIA